MRLPRFKASKCSQWSFVACFLLTSCGSSSTWLSPILVPMGSVLLADDPSKSASSRLTELRKLNDQFEQLVAKEADIRNAVTKAQQVLAKSERDMATVQDQAVQAQVAQMRAAVFQSQSIQMMSQPIVTPGSNSQNDQMAQILIANRNAALMQNALASKMEINIRAEQLNQLSNSARMIVQRHLDAMREIQKQAEIYDQWLADGMSYFPKYWEFGDPAGIYSKRENEAILAEFAKISDRNEPGRLVSALLNRRLGAFEAAKKVYDELIEKGGPFTAIALAARAELYGATEQLKKCKAEFALVMAHAKDDPYVRWMKALHDSRVGEWQAAEADLQVVLKHGREEVLTRRYIALILASKVKASKKNATKALEQMELVSNLANGKEWSVEIAHAFVLNYAGKTEEALEHAEKANDLAIDECKTFCEEAIEKIKNDEKWEWTFPY